MPEWNVEAVSAALHAVPEALGIGMGKVAQPLRVAITGTQVSPDIAHTVFPGRRGQALARIDAALAKILSGSGPPGAARQAPRSSSMGKRTPASILQHHVHDAAGFVAAVEPPAASAACA